MPCNDRRRDKPAARAAAGVEGGFGRSHHRARDDRPDAGHRLADDMAYL